MAGCSDWGQFLEIRGEFNALNVFIEFGDKLLDNLEEARQKEDEDASRRRGREGGYHGRNGGE
jgi:hypothetical protein